MSDARLRELERRWRESGKVEDHAAYLVEGVRAGTLREAMLELAAYCGNRAAELALGRTPPRASSPETFFAGLVRFGDDAVLCAVLAAAKEVQPVWNSRMGLDPLFADTLETFGSWSPERRAPGFAVGWLHSIELRHAESQDTIECAALRILMDLVRRVSGDVKASDATALEELFTYWREVFESLDPGWTDRTQAAVSVVVASWALGAMRRD